MKPPRGMLWTMGIGGLALLSGIYPVRGDAGLSPIAANLELAGCVNAIARQGDGKILVGGTFHRVNGQPRSHLARLHADGSLDTSFDMVFDGPISTLLIQGLNLFAGGSFYTVDDQPLRGLAKIDLVSGALNTNFNAEMDGYVYALAASGTNIYAGGSFATVGGALHYCVAKLDTTYGLADPAFTNYIIVGGDVNALALSGTNLYIGGTFEYLRDATRDRIARLNALTGATDPAFTNGASGEVDALAIGGGALYACGAFTNIGGRSQSGIAKLNLTNGLADAVFTNGSSGETVTFALSGTNLFVGGAFTNFGGIPCQRIARLNNLTGAANPAFTNSADDTVRALDYDGTNLLAGGEFSTIGGTTAAAMARLDPASGAALSSFAAHATVAGYARALAVQPDGGVLIGGHFDFVEGTPRRNLVRITSAGAVDASFNVPLQGDDIPRVNAMVIDGDAVIVGGCFTNAGGIPRQGLVKVLLTNGAVCDVFIQGATGLADSVTALLIVGTNLYVGGAFSSIGGTNRDCIAKLNAVSGAVDPYFTSDANHHYVYGLAGDGASLYAGGGFTNIGGATRNYIARLNPATGTADPGFTNGADRTILRVALYSNALYACGNFTNFDGASRQYVVKAAPADGAPDLAFNANVDYNSVSAMLLTDDTLYIGGWFYHIGAWDCPNLGRVDRLTGAIDPSFIMAPDDSVMAIARDGNRLYIGGYFNTVAGQQRFGFAVIDGIDTPPSIVSNPQSLSVSNGLAAAFNVAAAGTPPLYYQWQKDGIAIAGATSTNHTIAAVAPADAGAYRCLVTNLAGSCTSAAASLLVLSSPTNPPPPAPDGVKASDGTFATKVQIMWNAASGATGYQIWRGASAQSSEISGQRSAVEDQGAEEGRSQIGQTTGTNYNDTSATAGTRYYYWIKATNAAAYSGFSSSESGWCRSVGCTHYADVDMDGDRKMDLVIFDPVSGTWSAKLSASGYAVASTSLGGPGCTPVPGDYDGDIKVDPGVYAEPTGLWTVMLSSMGYGMASATLGGMGYAPVPGDFDGDRKTDLGVYQSATGGWTIKLSASGYAEAGAIFGGPDYLPVQRDYDGDRKADPALYQLATGDWRVMLSGSGYGIASALGFGGAGYAPVPGDYDGDGKTDPAIYAESSGTWAVMLSGNGYLIATASGFGGLGYTPLPGDYDGDGKTDPAVYCETTPSTLRHGSAQAGSGQAGQWLVMLSGSGYGLATAAFGGEGYDPVGFGREQ